MLRFPGCHETCENELFLTADISTNPIPPHTPYTGNTNHYRRAALENDIIYGTPGT